MNIQLMIDRRKEQGLTLNELARKMSIPYTTLYKWEKEINKPTKRNFQMWEDALEDKVKQEADLAREVELLRELTRSQAAQIELLNFKIQSLEENG